MTGLFLLAVVGLWLWLCVAIARKLMRNASAQPWRYLVGPAVFVVLLVAPVADELVGGTQFREMCEREAILRIDPTKVRDRTLRQVAVQSFPGDTLLRIEQWHNSFRDAATGEELASFSWLRVSGGWFIRSLGISEGNAPLLISPSSCWPKVQGRLDELYGFTLIKD